MSSRRSTNVLHRGRRLLFAAAACCAASTAVAAQPLAGRATALRYGVGGPVRPATQAAVFVVFSIDRGAAGHDSTDRWLARDKARHFGTSAAIQLMGYGILRITGMTRSRSMLGASVVTASAGMGKELWDRAGHGTASGRDLVWDAVGLLTGSGLAKIGDPP